MRTTKVRAMKVKPATKAMVRFRAQLIKRIRDMVGTKR